MSKAKVFDLWNPTLMKGLLKSKGLNADRLAIRGKIVKHIDNRGLNLTDAATLETFNTATEISTKLDHLLTPRPGEKTNLERILQLLESILRSILQVKESQKALDERLAVIELMLTERR